MLPWAIIGIAVIVGIAILLVAKPWHSNAAAPTPTSPAASAAAVSPTLAGATAEQVALRLSHVGVPLHTTIVYTAANDPNTMLGRPGGYTSKIAFSDPRISAANLQGTDPGDVSRGGSIEVFATSDAAQARAAYIRGVTKGSPLLAEYTYAHGPVVLRVSQDLTPDQAAAYDAALGRLGA